MHKAIDTY